MWHLEKKYEIPPMVAGQDRPNICKEGKILINEPCISIFAIKLQSGIPSSNSNSSYLEVVRQAKP